MAENQNPLEQFLIFNIFEYSDFFHGMFNFSNSALFMLLSVLMAALFFLFLGKGSSPIPSPRQLLGENIYLFVIEMVESNMGKEGLIYLPLIFTLFIFLCFANIVGLLPVPGAFAPTAHLAVTTALGLLVCGLSTVVGIKKLKWGFLRVLCPSGTPKAMIPIIVLIEFFAYIVRPFSLGIRLAANMIAGHTMVDIIASFVLKMNVLLGWAPFVFTVAIFVFEVFVALLQAYIFASLSCVYLNDSLHKH